MSDKRLVRGRANTPITGGLKSALARRNGRDTPRKVVVEFFGDDEDTPVMGYLKSTPPTMQEFRGGDHVHVSDVISKCVRKIALMRRMNMRHPQERIPDGKGITFAIGEAVHDYIKARITSGHPDKVYARWSCLCGTTDHVGLLADRPVKVCPKCDGEVSRHNEVPFVQEEYNLKGNPDLLLWLAEYNAFYITEIKSIAASAWKELVRPLPDHKVQVALYWHIMKSCGLPVVDRASILYANKEFSFKLPYKEFLVDPANVDLSPYYDDLEALKIANAGGDLPPRVFCGSDSAPDAKTCPVAVACFGCTR